MAGISGAIGSLWVEIGARIGSFESGLSTVNDKIDGVLGAAKGLATGLQSAFDSAGEKIKGTEAPLTKVEQAFKNLGVTSSNALSEAAIHAERDFELIRDSGQASARDLNAAWVKYEEARIAASRAVGNSISKDTTDAVARVKSELDTLNSNLDFGKIGSGLAGVGAAVTAALAPLALFGKAAITAASDMDSLKRGLGSVATASDTVETQLTRLKEVAKLPGLGLKEAVEGSINLQAAGVSAKLAEREMMAFGNALASVGKGKADLTGVITQLVQMSNKSKVVAGDLKPIMERVPQVATIVRAAFGTIDTEVIQKMGVSTKDFIGTVITGLEKLPKVSGGIKNAFENVGDSVDQMMVKVGNLFIPVIEKVMPFVEKLIAGMGDLVDWFDSLPGPVKAGAAAFVVLVAGLAALTTIVGGAMVAWTAFSGLFAAGGLLAGLGVTAAGFSGIALAIPLVLAALTALGAWIYSNWDGITAVVIQAWDGLSDIWGAAFSGVASLIAPILQPIIDIVKGIWTQVTATFDTVKDAVVDNIGLIAIALSPILVPAALAAAAIVAVGAALIALGKWVYDQWPGIVTIVADAWSAVSDTWGTVWEGTSAALVASWEAIGSTAASVWSGTVSILNDVWNSVSETWATIWETITSVLTSAWDSVVSEAEALWTPIATFFSTLWDDTSAYFTSIWEGILKTLSGAWQSITSVAASLWNPVVKFFSTLWDDIGSYFASAWNSINRVLDTVWGAIKSTAISVWTSITDAIGSFLQAAAKIPGVNKLLNLDDAWQSAKQASAELKNAGKAADTLKASAESAGGTGKPIPKLAEGIAKVGKEAKTTTEHLKPLQYQNAELDATVKVQTDSWKKLGAEVATAKAKLIELGDSVGKMIAPSDAMNASLTQIISSMGNLQKAGPPLQGSLDLIKGSTNDLGLAFKTLGVSAEVDYQKVADATKVAYDAVKGSGIATPTEENNALLKMLKAQRDAAKANGETIPADTEKMIAKLESAVTTGLPKSTTAFENFGTEVSTIITNLAQDLGKSLFSGDGSFVEKGIGALKRIGEAAVSQFVEPFAKAGLDLMNGVISDLMGGKGFGGLLDRVKEVGATIGKLFGAGSDAVGSVAGAAGQAGGAAGSAGSSAGSVAGGIAGAGVTAIVGAIGSVAGAVSGIIGNFQNAHQETSLNAIEHNTRYSMMYLGERGDGGILGVLFVIAERLQYLNPLLDGVNKKLDDWLAPLNTQLTYLNTTADALGVKLDTWLEPLGNRLTDLYGRAELGITKLSEISMNTGAGSQADRDNSSVLNQMLSELRMLSSKSPVVNVYVAGVQQPTSNTPLKMQGVLGI